MSKQTKTKVGLVTLSSDGTFVVVSADKDIVFVKPEVQGSLVKVGGAHIKCGKTLFQILKDDEYTVEYTHNNQYFGASTDAIFKSMPKPVKEKE